MTTTPALVDARQVIEDAILNQPRSLQKRIGPSSLGNPCEHCLAAELAGWEQTRDVAWLPFIGTAVHAELDTIFTLANHPEFRWTTEKRVTVGTVGGQTITGSCDVFDHQTGTVIDWKIVGKTTLDKAKRRRGPSSVYRTQAHLYGLGFQNAGETVNHVAIAFLPRNAMSLDHAVWWSEPYDPQVAHDAIHRADQLATTLLQLEAVSVEARDAYVTSLPRDPDCWDCNRYPDRASMAVPYATSDGLDGLLITDHLVGAPTK